MQSTNQPIELYMQTASKVKASLKHGEIKLFLKKYKGKISRATVTNALNGSYYKNGQKIPYQNMAILDLLHSFVESRESREKEIAETIINS